MLFSRSNNGLNNLHLFYGVEVMVYIEGENKIDKYDKNFYQIILNKILNVELNKFEIMPLGSCDNVKSRYEEILLNNISNSICVLDRDYNFIKQSFIYNPDLLKFTYGYSWESDFWSDKMIYRVIEILSGGRVSQLSNINNFILNTKERAKKVSCLDLIAQINSECVLEKDKSSFGIRLEYDASTLSVISEGEIQRMHNKLPPSVSTCLISQGIYSDALNIVPEKMIQGHFWQKIAFVLIVQSLKMIGLNSTTISEEMIFNIAKTSFNEDIDKFMDDNIKGYYLENFKIC